ncbi:MAG: response regulator [Desulfobacterales bacterium]|nr:response regulator [Desulfobacterales bacterium]
MKTDTISGTCVLLVEDDSINQQIIAELLKSAGIIVSLADNGSEAVTAVNNSDPGFDGVLMDVQMPEMDGYEATRIIRKRPENAELPIIAMTANATAEDRQKCIDAGMNDHISKPVEPGLLFEALAKWLPGQNMQPQDDPGNQGGQILPDRLDGIDMETGLRRTGGKPAFYAQMLADFSVDHGDDFELIMAALDRLDLDLTTRLAHNLKGVSGGIGAMSLHEAARRLESHLKGEQADELESLLDAVRKELRLVTESLKQNLKIRCEKPGTGQADDSGIESLINGIRTMAEEMNPGAEDKAGDLYRIISRTDSKASGRLKALAGNLVSQTKEFEFEAAIATLDEISAALLK